MMLSGFGPFGGAPEPGAFLLKKIRRNDERITLEHLATIGDIGCCSECKRPFPDHKPQERYVCKDCQRKAAILDNPVALEGEKIKTGQPAVETQSAKRVHKPPAVFTRRNRGH